MVDDSRDEEAKPDGGMDEGTSAPEPDVDPEMLRRAAVNYAAYVIERTAGLHDPNRLVTMADLDPGLFPEGDTDPAVLKYLARLLERRVAEAADDTPRT
ncbi:hypothetical protein [Embleya sp. MST-111070]|uniref:hypothetical protein n=1 Tax=Embleya sp. MST-111070 TaxID=3398231 RepID=UPI003F7399EB